MNQGFAYGDSNYQYCIAKTPHALNETQREAVDVLLAPFPDEFKNCMDYLSSYVSRFDAEHFIKKLQDLLTNSPSIATELTPMSLTRLFSLSKSPTIHDLEPVDFDGLDKMEPEVRTAALQNISTARLVWRSTTFSGLARAIPYIPASERFNVVSIMLKEGGRDEWSCGWYDLVGSMKGSSDGFFMVLNSLSEEERFNLLKARDKDGRTVLHAAVTFNKDNPTFLSKILAIYKNDAQRVEALNEVDKSGNSVLRNAVSNYNLDSIDMLLDLYSEEELFTAVKEQRGDHDHTLLIAATDDFMVAILKRLSPEHRLEALIQESSNGFTAIGMHARPSLCENASKNNFISAMLECLSEDERVEVVKDFHLLHTYAKYPTVIVSILNLLPADRRLEVIESKRRFKDSWNLDIERVETLLHSAIQAGSSDSVAAILEMYPKERRLEACLEESHSQYGSNNGILVDSLSKPDCFAAILKSMPDDESRLEIWNTIEAANKWELILVHASPALLAIIPENLLFNAVTKNDDSRDSLLHRAVHDKPTLFTTILTNLPDKLQFEALKTKSIRGITVWNYVVDHPDLLANIPKKVLLASLFELEQSGFKVLSIARYLPIEEFTSVLHAAKHRLSDLIESIFLFTVSMQNLSEDQRSIFL